MIQRLKSTDYPELYRLQQQAYRVEAELIGAALFPPLLQTEAALREEHPTGYIMRLDGRLVGAVTVDGETITRLLVSPDYFRQGIATQLLRYACGTTSAPLRFDGCLKRAGDRVVSKIRISVHPSSQTRCNRTRDT